MKGEQIFNYVLDDQLGAGGFGEVWSATHTLTGDRVAVKVLYQTALYDLVEALKKEALLLHRLTQHWQKSHTGPAPFVRFIDVGEVNNHPAIIMEMLHGRELRDVIDDDKRMRSVDETLAVIRPLLEALETAHRQGIVHRDIKPENIFMCDDGTIKVMDLGIAKVQQTVLAKSTKIFGSLQYMAPERFEAVTTPGVDVYAVGLIAWELLAGRPACEHDTPTGAMKWHVMKGADPIQDINPQVPDWLAEAITGMVEIEPELRTASAAEALAALKGHAPSTPGTQWVKREPIPAPPIERSEPTPTPAPQRAQSTPVGPAPVTTPLTQPTTQEVPRAGRGPMIGFALVGLLLVGVLVLGATGAAGALYTYWDSVNAALFIDPLDVDDDGDGYTENAGDCDDSDPALNPADADGDGLSSCEDDCDDNNAIRISTEIDQDCDGVLSGEDCDDNDPNETTVCTRISAGTYHSCAITPSEQVVCWGSNRFGQLNAPVGRFKSVRALAEHTCAITTNGEVKCWGRRAGGEAGIDHNTDRELPSKLIRPPSDRFTEIHRGYYRVCGLTTSGAMKCWGEDQSDINWTPSDPDRPFTSLAVGQYHQCALDDSGTAVCRGDNTYGESDPPPEPFSSLHIRAPYSTWGLTTTGEVRCWGSSQSCKYAPKGRFLQITTHCGIRIAGDVECWGRGIGGEEKGPSGKFSKIVTKRGESCGIEVNGNLKCWRSGNDGLVMAFNEPRYLEPGDPNTPPKGTFTAMSIGNSSVPHACALDTSGRVQCWGGYSFRKQNIPDEIASIHATQTASDTTSKPTPKTTTSTAKKTAKSRASKGSSKSAEKTASKKTGQLESESKESSSSGGLGGLLGAGPSKNAGGSLVSKPERAWTTPGVPKIVGPLDKSPIESVINQNLNRIQYCYQRAVINAPTLQGKIKVKFIISEDGTVYNAVIESSSMNNSKVEDCITTAFKRFKFPKPKGESMVMVSYPFAFQPG